MNSPRYDKAISMFDEYNASDPNGKELLYSRRMSERLESFRPGSPEHIRLAVRCQHIGRWKIPRSTFPEGKKGYIAWRNKLKSFHADTAGGILRDSGYDEESIHRVQDLLLKKDLRSNPDTQLLEDVVCLVFVEFYLDDFAAKHEDEKVIDILSKTLKKMSADAIGVATHFNIATRTRELLMQAAAGHQ